MLEREVVILAAVGLEGAKQGDAPILVGKRFAVHERHIEEEPPVMRLAHVEATGQREVSDLPGFRIGGKGLRRIAEQVARQLVERQHERQGAIPVLHPAIEPPRGGGGVERPETPGQD